MNKPAFIVKFNQTHNRYEAYNEDGVMIDYNSISGHMLVFSVEDKDYIQVSLNSRCSRTILDKINQHSL